MAKKDLPNKKENYFNSRESNIDFDKYFTFFENAPVSLWIEDFSKAKLYIDSLIKDCKTDIKTYINNNPQVISKIVSLVSINEVNKITLKLYKAESKEQLLDNLNIVFTEKSNEGFSKLLVDILLGKKETTIETVNKTLKGDEFNVLVNFKVADGSEETLDKVIVSVEDVTERLQIRNALAESESRYKESQSIAKIGSWYYNFKEKKLNWSDELFYMLGLEAQSQTPSLEYYLSIIHKEDLNLVNNFQVEYLLNNPIKIIKYRIKTKKGELKYVYEKRTVIIENGKIVRIIGICQDITENVISEKKLNTTKNLLSNTLSSIKDGFVILDHNSNYLYLNKEAADILGKPVESLIGNNIWAEFPEKEGDVFFDEYQKAFKSRKPVTFENYFSPWGRWFENRMIPSKDGMLILFNEITHEKISEFKIREAYNIINKSSSVAILCENAKNFPVVFASENAIDLFGYTHIELLNGKVKIHELVHPDDLLEMRMKFFEFRKESNSERFKANPIRILTKSGEIKWVEVNYDINKNEKGKTTHIQGVIQDVTGKKKAQDLFFESNQRLEDQFRNTPLASIIWDPQMKVLEWNNSAQRIFGYSAEEIKGKNGLELIVPENIRPNVNCVAKNLLDEKGGYRNTNDNITKNGDIITCDWYNVALKDAEGNSIGIASLAEDITEKLNSKKLLEKSEKKYRDIFEKSIDSVMILKDGFFEDCNESTLRIFGYEDKNLLIKLHLSQLSPDFQPDGTSSFLKAEELIKIAIEKGSNRFRWYHKRKNGQVFPAEVSLTKIEENDDKIAIHAVIRDITERVKNEELEGVIYNISKAALTINNFHEFGEFIKNELHKIIDTNNFYIALYNEENDTISAPFIIDEYQFEVQDIPAEKTLTGYVIKTQKPLKVNTSEHEKLIKEGKVDMVGPKSKVWIGAPLKTQEKVFGAIVVQSYLSEDSYSESDVQLLEFVANQISSSIQIRNSQAELKNALFKAQESDRLKSAFLANMSHEIRTPMNGIIGFSELFLDSNLADNDRREYAKIVINSSKQLLSIVNDVLDISKIEAGAVQLYYSNVNINKLLEDLLQFYSPIAKDNNLQINYKKALSDEDSIISIDKTKLNQVLTNLLSNAFKFTEKGGVEFGYEFHDTELKFYVKDSGIGIDKKLQDRIFDRFIQAEVELNRQNKGTGLGLSISKKFIELFKGKMWIESDKKGTTVFFTIPFIKVKSLKVRKRKKEKIEMKSKKDVIILVAEDEEYNMIYINELFSNSCYKIIAAENGAKAVDLALNNNEIDIVFMDIKMPVMNGNDAMQKIKEVKPNLPIIALSAFAMESDKEKALSKGFDSYLTKPIDKEELFNLIDKYLN
ncbi:PAS domain S-box protein [Lutibacter citreus]|uniref:PAS domain S-box protein n=1 Tax=Lutibacter citreus TaxID=2138210 RepID=UPI000DBE5AC9|nr:PAS domain S-box protein [Lutibacter citreus]